MPRLKPNDKRPEKIKRQYLGKALVFCEGTTEYNYIEYFTSIINSYSKYTDVCVTLENVEGDAKTVYKYAESYLSCEEMQKKYKSYDKYLVFDCDAPKNIEDVLRDIDGSKNDYIILLSNIVFEVWLVMHEEVVCSKLTKVQIYKKMAEILGCEYYGSKEKANKGYIRKLIGDGSNVRKAINNAKQLEQEYINFENNITDNLSMMDPYTKMHIFIEKILAEIDDVTISCRESKVLQL